MNDHAIYIVLAYGLGAFILIWTAVTPLLKKRRLMEQLKIIQGQKEQSEHRNTD